MSLCSRNVGALGAQFFARKCYFEAWIFLSESPFQSNDENYTLNAINFGFFDYASHGIIFGADLEFITFFQIVFFLNYIFSILRYAIIFNRFSDLLDA